ncbi:uncharacterized protein E0L32_009925 [Thyridium curvatum]|uniref:Carrier domain-containing protein n=1 Tax=Thyridium curvatum TaxID=1093900 RepID=A0A507APE0_9PEZI|nr:uncharacterized protein E0L32_009925 [Thyridium curvatum]TPX08586.1 hypothetical protein E0L32_009925 [Thyridium curvatum]
MPIIDTRKDLAALFAAQVEATPDAPALEDGPKTWTYAELDRDVTALAQRLRRHGVGRDDPVGVLMGRGGDYVIACLAALRAGGAFLVLELAYPPGLLANVIDDAKPKVILTQKAHAAHIKADVPIFILDEPVEQANGSATNGHAKKELPPLPADDDLDRLAFISYSSGTTGTPKGIANPHRAPVLSYDLRFQVSDLGPGDRVACNVFFIWEIIRPLLRGATVITVPDEASYDPVSLVNLLSEKRVTETLMTPTLLATVISRHPKLGSRLPHLKTVWFNGEVVYTDLVRRAIKALPSTRLLNCYSASETHEIACGDLREMLDDDSSVCAVGPLMDPRRMYVLDESGTRKVEQGDVGELFVGGDLLARGYLNLPETTAKAFVADPFDPAPGARMYRTGDLARILPSGLLQITGRVGSMVKIRGYTIQIGAVEHAITKHLAVRTCAVVTHGDGLERQLVAYIVHDKEEPGDRTVPTVDETGHSPVSRRVLAQHLAQYMIPALWVELEEMPTHEVSQKADYARLPPPPTGRKTNGTKDEDKDIKISLETIRQLWAESLNVGKAAITQEHDFFDMGGHSLSLADLGSRISRTFGFPVPLPRLAEDPTLEGHLKVVRAARDGHTAAVQADLPGVMKADATLPDDIQASGAEFCQIKEATTILLTGVTGFLGAFLLKDLLENTSAQIVCLVRFPNPTEQTKGAGMARLRKNLLDLGIWDDAVLDRVEIQPGNLARKRFGLPNDDFEELARRVQVVIHAGATVNLVYPYAAMRGVNVGGTREILRLAGLGGATVHHISTNGVLPPSAEGWDEDTVVDVGAAEKRLLDGYGQTKWVAEQLVLEAGRRGLPARIYRPGTISGHTASGSTNTYDLVNAVLVESLHLGYSPDVDGWLLEMTPVDFVARSVVALANYKGTTADQQTVFHLGEPNPCTANAVFEHMAELGYPTKKLKWDDWMAKWSRERGDDKTEDNSFTVGILRNGMPSEGFLKLVTVLKDPRTAPVLAKCWLTRPSIDRDLWRTYIRHFYARGWLPRPPLQGASTAAATPQEEEEEKKGPLAGRVAVVVGASSGMGAAIATKLIKEGAKVALAARRPAMLEALKKKCGGTDANVLVHPTDVTKREQVEELVRAAAAKLGGDVEILVNCAGVMYYTLMAGARTEQWEQTVDVNCKGLLHCLAAAVPGFLARGKGHVVAITSDAGRKVFPGLGVYSGSKFFMEGVLQALRLETAGTGLRVTSVQPGNVRTDLLSMSTDDEAVAKYGAPSGAKVLAPEEVADAVVYALSQPEHVAVNEILIEPRDEPI